MSKQQATLSKLYSTLLLQTATMSNDSIIKFRPFDKVECCFRLCRNEEISFDVVAETGCIVAEKDDNIVAKTATMSKQHSTLSKESFNLLHSTMLLGHCC